MQQEYFHLSSDYYMKSKTTKQSTEKILAGEDGPARSAVLLNSAFALVAADKAGSFAEGVELAAQSIDSKAAQGKLEQLKEITNR